MKVAPEISEALSLGRAVVALESTIISHGFYSLYIYIYMTFCTALFISNTNSLIWVMLLFVGMPYPQNLETAKEVEGIVRENGAVPATIAILDGVPCVGIY